MRKSKYSESQIAAILQEAEAGVAVAEVARKHGISAATFYQWRSKHKNGVRFTYSRLNRYEAGDAPKTGSGSLTTV